MFRSPFKLPACLILPLVPLAFNGSLVLARMTPITWPDETVIDVLHAANGSVSRIFGKRTKLLIERETLQADVVVDD
jgi:hypothetical protein